MKSMTTLLIISLIINLTLIVQYIIPANPSPITATQIQPSDFNFTETVSRLKAALTTRHIPLFAEFDHAHNAQTVGLNLYPTTVLVFGSPKVGTQLMQIDQSIALELPLRIAIWEDAQGKTWLSQIDLQHLASVYNIKSSPVLPQLQTLLSQIIQQASTSTQ